MLCYPNCTVKEKRILKQPLGHHFGIQCPFLGKKTPKRCPKRYCFTDNKWCPNGTNLVPLMFLSVGFGYKCDPYFVLLVYHIRHKAMESKLKTFDCALLVSCNILSILACISCCLCFVSHGSHH